jgi:hypothetical protein
MKHHITAAARCQYTILKRSVQKMAFKAEPLRSGSEQEGAKNIK